MVAGLAVVGGVLAAWHHHAGRSRFLAMLPALPDVSARPAAFGEALRKAAGQALLPQTEEDGVAEMGRLYQANDFGHEAEACWAILRLRHPNEARWCYYLADLRRTAGDDEAMASLLEQTVTLAPDYAPAWLKLAEREYKTGQLEAAERDYRRRLELLPADPYARLGLARVMLQHDRRDEGRRLIEKIISDTPGFSSAHNLYAEILAADGNTAGAERQRSLGHIAVRFREAEDPWLDELHAWCFDPYRLAVLASVEELTQHGDRGVSLLNRAIQLAPNDPKGYSELGLTYLSRGDAAKARSVLEKGALLPNASSALYVSLSLACCALHQPEDALHFAERGLVAAPDAPELHNVRGVALQAAGRVEEAVAEYRLVTQRAPNLCEGYFNLGRALLQLGQTDEAYVNLQHALVLDATYWKALAMLGKSEMDAGRLESASKYLHPLFENYPQLPASRQLMTRWYLQAGMMAARSNQRETAETDLRAGLDIDPNAPDLHAQLGLLYASERRLTEAVEQLETYHRLQPAEANGELFLGQVYADLNRPDDARRNLAEGARLARQAGDWTAVSRCEAALQKLPAAVPRN
jgi:HemY protein